MQLNKNKTTKMYRCCLIEKVANEFHRKIEDFLNLMQDCFVFVGLLKDFKHEN